MAARSAGNPHRWRAGALTLAVLAIACGGRSTLDADGVLAGGGAGGTSATGGEGPGGQHTGTGGDCGPTTPVELAAGADSGAYFLTGDATHVYWTNAFEHTVKKVPHCGGEVVTLASDGQSPFMVQVDGTHAYWSNWVFTGSIERVSLAGGALETLWASGGQPEGIAADETFLYVAVVADMNGQDVGVWRLPKGGGVAERIYAGAVVRAIAVDEAFVYTGSVPSNDAAQLVRIPKSGGAPSALAQTLVLGAIALDEENVYWTTWGGPTSTPGNVLRISKQGGAVEVIHDGEPGVVAGVAVDDSHVYWTSQQAGAVRARPKAGGATLTLATGQGTTETVVTSGPWIFWVNFDDSSVWRAAKP